MALRDDLNDKLVGVTDPTDRMTFALEYRQRMLDALVQRIGSQEEKDLAARVNEIFDENTPRTR